MYGSCSRTEDLDKYLKSTEDATLSAQAGIWIQTEKSLPFAKPSFKTSLLLGLEDSREKPLDLDPCEPAQTAGACEGPCLLSVFIYKKSPTSQVLEN